MISLLVLCYPTYGRVLHLDAKGTSVVLAPDQMLLLLSQMGVRIEVANLSPFPTEIPLMCSRLVMKSIDQIDPANFDYCWHMFRDPTQPEVMDQAGTFKDWFQRTQVINHVDQLSLFYKRFYLPVLEALGIGPRVLNIEPSSLEWSPTLYGTAISTCKKFVRSCDYNNNRGDYREREARGDVITAFLDGSESGARSFFRVGYARGSVLPGWLYTAGAENFILKSGTCSKKEKHQIPVEAQGKVIEAMEALGIDVAHIEGTYVQGTPMIFDINPYPTSYGTSLAVISKSICEALFEEWRPQ